MNIQVKYGFTVSIITFPLVYEYPPSFNFTSCGIGRLTFGRHSGWQKTHAFAKATCFFEALPSLLSLFTKVTCGFSGGCLAEHQITSLYVELTYCKSSYIITFPAGKGNKITQYKPLISVYPFAGLGAYVPSPGIRINRYFAPSGRPAASLFSVLSPFRSSSFSSYSSFYPRNSRTQFHSRPFYLYSRTSHIHFSSTL